MRRKTAASTAAAAKPAAWLAEGPRATGRFATDAARTAAWCARGDALVRDLPPAAAARIKDAANEARHALFRAHPEALYDAVADGDDGLRVDDLAYAVATRYPGLLPTRRMIADELARAPDQKEGHELAQALFVAALLDHPRVGHAMIAAMGRPTARALELLATFRERGTIDLGKARLVRDGVVGTLVLSNPEFLNAEDDALLEALECGLDLLLLDPAVEVVVLRGDVMQHPKYRGRRVFCSGLNLTHLAQGKLSYLYFVLRELGLVNKLYRGLSAPAIEKPWIGVVEAHAIGGGCQLLLVADHVIAEAGSYFAVPARNEGFVPGVAGLRLPRYMGQRLSREMIFHNRAVSADSPEGRLLVDEVVSRDSVDAAIEKATTAFASSGAIAIAANRRALRIGAEPLDVFRTVMASFAIDQARCVFKTPAAFGSTTRDKSRSGSRTSGSAPRSRRK